MKKIIFVILCLFNLNAFASIAFPTGNEIYETCSHLTDVNFHFEPKQNIIVESMKEGQNIGMCYSVADTAFTAISGMGYSWAVDNKFVSCMNNYYKFNSFTGQQILDLTIKYLKDNPKYRNLSIVTVMVLMLHDEFPASVCGASSPSDMGRAK